MFFICQIAIILLIKEYLQKEGHYEILIPGRSCFILLAPFVLPALAANTATLTF
jgi:hypothetical protein